MFFLIVTGYLSTIFRNREHLWEEVCPVKGSCKSDFNESIQFKNGRSHQLWNFTHGSDATWLILRHHVRRHLHFGCYSSWFSLVHAIGDGNAIEQSWYQKYSCDWLCRSWDSKCVNIARRPSWGGRESSISCCMQKTLIFFEWAHNSIKHCSSPPSYGCVAYLHFACIL